VTFSNNQNALPLLSAIPKGVLLVGPGTGKTLAKAIAGEGVPFLAFPAQFVEMFVALVLRGCVI